jgi:hypothetical protein
VRAVYIVVGCDVDPDRAALLNGASNTVLTWRGATEGIPAAKTLLRGLTDIAGREPAFTWFLRADDQVRQVHGAYAWFVEAHEPMLRSLEQSGDELGWHPHFWRYEAAADRWFQEIDDIGWQLDMLRQAHRHFAPRLPQGLHSVRMGWGYQNDRTCETLEELGIAVDASSLPGFHTVVGEQRLDRENLFDWRDSPRVPYRPSQADYRRPPRGQERPRRLLEIPSFVSRSRLWGLAGGVQLVRKTGHLEHLWSQLRQPSYCINVTGRPALFAPVVAQLRQTLRQGGNEPVVFATHCHADEFVPNRSPLYDLAAVRTNLAAVLRVCAEARAPAAFVRASQVPALWPA